MNRPAVLVCLISPPVIFVAIHALPVGQYYDAGYFAWQNQYANIAAQEAVPLFQPSIRPADKIADFGCGGGYLL